MAYSQELMGELIKAQDNFVWEAPAWERHERGSRWYILMSLIAIAFVIYAVVTGAFTLALLILLVAIILILAGNQQPDAHLIQIGPNGVVVGGKLYEYKDLSDFSIIYQPPQTKLLYLESNSYFRPRIRLFLMDQDPVEIRNHLKQYVEENLLLQEEHLSDILARLLRL